MAPVNVLTWLHLSDLHFGAGPHGHRFHSEALLDDVKRHKPITPTSSSSPATRPPQSDKAPARSPSSGGGRAVPFRGR